MTTIVMNEVNNISGNRVQEMGGVDSYAHLDNHTAAHLRCVGKHSLLEHFFQHHPIDLRHVPGTHQQFKIQQFKIRLRLGFIM